MTGAHGLLPQLLAGVSCRMRRGASVFLYEISAGFRPSSTAPGVGEVGMDNIHYLATTTTTRGEFGLCRVEMRAKTGGSKTHFYKSISESFYILESTVRLFNGAEWIDAQKGDFLHCYGRRARQVLRQARLILRGVTGNRSSRSGTSGTTPHGFEKGHPHAVPVSDRLDAGPSDGLDPDEFVRAAMQWQLRPRDGFALLAQPGRPARF